MQENNILHSELMLNCEACNAHVDDIYFEEYLQYLICHNIIDIVHFYFYAIFSLFCILQH